MRAGDGSADLEPLIRNIETQVRAGVAPVEAGKQLLAVLNDRDRVNAALTEYLRRVGAIRLLKEPAGLHSDDIGAWYSGPSPDDRFWPALERSLRGRGWDDEAVGGVDSASTKIVSLLPPPGLASFHTRGLVLGYVQSGKTANYTAVIAKSADVYYRLFIVLAGVHNALRSQTQDRLEQELCNLNREDWVSLTTLTDDFRLRAAPNPDFFLTTHRDQRVLMVIKKNGAVLRRVIRWLRAAREAVLAACPILIVDDEADQAGVNASTDAQARTRLNELLIELLTTPPKAAYIGYTATPFANLLIDPSQPDDLYPRDFIIDLPRPEGYFGPERIFGRDRLSQEEGDEIDGLDMVRRIPDEEVGLVKPSGRDHADWSPDLTPSLRASLDYFLVATAARRARGDPDLDSSMLIHTSMYTDVHEQFRPLVLEWHNDVARAWRNQDPGITERLRDVWEREAASVPAHELNEPTTTFDELSPHLAAVLDELDVIIENSRSQIRLDYGEAVKPRVVIGGNTLSRGLTLRGLIVSYFVRTASAYDTLLQMGRWFGYRAGYADLPRVWMTEELEAFFFDLATVEHEVRQDIKLYELEGTTPLDFAVRIRTHPALTITARAKMQAAVDASMSFGGRRPQMIYYRHRDAAWLNANREAARRLVEVAVTEGALEQVDASWLIRNVSARSVLDFVESYRFHDRNEALQGRLLAGYVRDQNGEGELHSWNVAVISRRPRPGDRMIEVGPGISVPPLNRAKIEALSDDENAYLKAITSHVDIAIDLEMSADDVARASDAELIERRRRGLLLLYPIDGQSVPRGASGATRQRVPLEAVDDMIGVAFVFPPAAALTPQGYMSADLSRVQREPLDLAAEEDEEEEAAVQ
jgi:hypothetical protein